MRANDCTNARPLNPSNPKIARRRGCSTQQTAHRHWCRGSFSPCSCILAFELQIDPADGNRVLDRPSHPGRHTIRSHPRGKLPVQLQSLRSLWSPAWRNVRAWSVCSATKATKATKVDLMGSQPTRCWLPRSRGSPGWWRDPLAAPAAHSPRRLARPRTLRRHALFSMRRP
jgi:hypothetical protein